jgi:S-DNA-T family DNA segregation ATPase FtsK/SpoIIIE
LLPIPLLLIGYKRIRRRPLEFPFVKLAGVFCLLAAATAGTSLLQPPWPDRFNFLPGGILGAVIADRLVAYLNRVGALIVICTVFVLALVLTTRFSIDALLQWLGAHLGRRLAGVLAWWAQWKRRRHRARLERAKSQGEAVVLQPVPPRSLGPPAEQEEQEEAAEQEQEQEQGAPPEDEAQDEIEPPSPVTTPQPPPWISKQVIPRDDLDSEARDGVPSPRPRPAHLDRPPDVEYRPPPVDFLQQSQGPIALDESELRERAEKLTRKCGEFGVIGHVAQAHPGPVVTTFEFRPDPGVRYSRITSLVDDLCLALKAESIRIDRLPGKNTVGVEVPNLIRQTILAREILASPAFQQSKSCLTLGLGTLINGDTFVTDLARMPHLLIAGATGSGKSVGLNCMVCSIVYKAGPQQVRFIMIDPKRLELGLYDGIPHLLTPIVTDPRQAANALNWAVIEMEERYRRLAQHGVRNIEQYNRLVEDLGPSSDLEEVRPLPYIVVIVDELADLMMTTGKEVEGSLTRLAQMARAIGIHLILATQRPSVDVLTGLIKANFPSRISFRVSSKVDSRTILDCNGAEQLLGQGDMLFLSPGSSRLTRIHGAYLSEKEIVNITAFLRQQGAPEYKDEILAGEEEQETDLTSAEDLQDDLFEEAARFVVETGKASTSLLQRRLRIGYGRAARLLDMMQRDGLIGPPDGSKAREVLVPPDCFDEPRRQ